MTSRPRVIVTRRLPGLVERRLDRLFNAELNREDRPFAPAELRRALAEADGVLCTVSDRIDAAVLSAEPMRARILANFGVGYDHIDLARARTRGLVVTNTPGVLTEATADLAMALILMVARRLGEGERELRRGEWKGWAPTHLMGTDVSGRTLGIIGFGRIGQAVSRRASLGFGMRVLSYSPGKRDHPPAGAPAVEQVGLEELLEQSDFVSLHCPVTPATRHMMNRERLARMKPSAILINTARGEVVDEVALVEALASGRIAGAGLDVFEREPQVPSGLLERPTVVLLPHLGSATESTRTAMGMKAVDNLEAFFRSGTVPDEVGDSR
jgi:lactate dehydrogenase-like 2-hydroxyacid dehydrogenase